MVVELFAYLGRGVQRSQSRQDGGAYESELRLVATAPAWRRVFAASLFDAPDPTARYPSPPSEIWTVSRSDNWGRVRR